MYKLSLKHHFDAAHFLPKYNGKCKNLHGHTWSVLIEIESDELDSQGMVIDFGEIKSTINEFDHSCINDKPPFDKIQPTAENISREIFGRLKKKLLNGKIKVTIWESPDASITYNED